jgi:hypothetical protein
MSRVTSVNHVEMIRDGGSFSATFVDPSHVEHVLWFPIAFRLSACVGHGDPFVARVVRFADETKVGWSFEDVRPVTWGEALSLLEEIRPLIPRADTWSLRWFEEMVGVAQRSGALLPGQWL